MPTPNTQTATATAPANVSTDFEVADLTLAAWGRKEIAIAETEMPGLMAIRKEYAAAQPLKGARITGSLHMTIQTAVLIETLEALGRESALGELQYLLYAGSRRRRDCLQRNPVFAKKGETLEEYWDYTHKIFDWSDGGYTNMILDDGGDATLLLHLGSKAEQDIVGSGFAWFGRGKNPLCVHQGKTCDRPDLVLGSACASAGRDRRNHDRRPPLDRNEQARRPEFARLQRQRFRDQIQVRQPVRLPRIACRRHQARDRRDDRR